MVKRSLRGSKVPKSRRGRKTMNRYKVSRGSSKVLRKRLKVSKNIKKNKTKRNKTKRNKTRQKQKGGAKADVVSGTLLRKHKRGKVDKYIIYKGLVPDGHGYWFGKTEREFNEEFGKVFEAYEVDEKGQIGELQCMRETGWKVQGTQGEYENMVQGEFIHPEDMSRRMKYNYDNRERSEGTEADTEPRDKTRP